jgi:hypothetical protein
MLNHYCWIPLRRTKRLLFPRQRLHWVVLQYPMRFQASCTQPCHHMKHCYHFEAQSQGVAGYFPFPYVLHLPTSEIRQAAQGDVVLSGIYRSQVSI